jgi:glucose-6-phosphate isomerase
MSNALRYDPTAARKLLPSEHFHELEPELLSARDEAFEDVKLWESGGEIPTHKDPLDAGFIPLPAKMLAGRSNGELQSIQTTAARLREELGSVVSLGIGGSYMGARALFEALCHRYHNELPAELRASHAGGRAVPRMYFEGNNLDTDSMQGLLDLLESQSQSQHGRDKRWGIVVISKSGGTLETAAAFRVFRAALEKRYGADSEEARKYIIPVTGETGKLRNLSKTQGYADVFPIPDGVGGRFSVFSAVGLLPAAVLGLDVEQLLQGAVDMTELCRSAPLGENPVLDYVAVCHLMEEEQGAKTRILSTWGSRLEALGLWYDQLLAESLGKEEKGAFPLTVVNTRDLHSRGQQHQEGTRDKLITNLYVESPSTTPITLPKFSGDEDQLNQHAGKTVPEMLKAAFDGTNQAYAEVHRPTADFILPKLDEYAMGQILQLLMLATVIEGRLIGINPYGQPGVEAYKKNMTAILAGK